MTNAALSNDVKVSENFTDIVYLTNKGQMRPEIKQLLRKKNLSSLVLEIDKFPQVVYQLKCIGTAIVDTKGLDIPLQQKLAGIIESLIIKNVGVILLSDGVELPLQNFLEGLATRSFSSVTTMQLVSIDALWATISVNLAYRKKSSRMAVKPNINRQNGQNANIAELAEQLRMTEAVAGDLTEQLRMAGHLQRDFLPTQMPACDQLQWATTFLPVQWASGDIYDIARIDEQHIGFYIADVVGHGMPAALLTIFIKQALIMRQIIGNNYRIFSPAEVMKNLNLRMTEIKLSGCQFVTCCYCLLNIKTLQLTYARAGHPYPILIRPQQQPQQLEIRGSLLGIFENAEYNQRTIQLQSGDKLLLHSDGVEPIIGSFHDKGGFNFSEEFCGIKDFPIVEMIDKFNTLAGDAKTKLYCIDDDITIIGLEIL